MSSEGGLLDGLDVFYGATSNNLARVYARVHASGAFHAPYEEFSLSGYVRGPECEYAKTIPATSPLVSSGPGESLLAQAVVPDPCFWSPDVPSRYLVQVELRHNGKVLETVERELAIRAFGPRGKSLFLEGKRWVLRGVESENALPADLSEWHEARAAMLVANPNDELCREATRLGILLVARVAGPASEVVAELRRLARFGAVAVAVVESANVYGELLCQAAPNLVFAQACSPASGSFQPLPWAQLVIASVDEPARFAACFKSCPLPIVSQRYLTLALPVAEARAACDDLQRDLAPFGDYAGYVV